MLNAVLKLTGITAAVVVLVGMFVVVARVNGLRQVAQAPPHPWFDRPTWDVRSIGPGGLCAHPPPPAKDVIYVLPVRKTPTEWRVICAEATPLDAFLKQTTHADWLIDVEAGAGEDLDNLVDIVANSGPRRIGIHADSQRAARALRKKVPGWVFAADDASMLRLKMFTQAFLGPAIDFWPDFVLAGRADKNELNADAVGELHRRGKRVVWIGGGAAPFPVDAVLANPLTK